MRALGNLLFQNSFADLMHSMEPRASDQHVLAENAALCGLGDNPVSLFAELFAHRPERPLRSVPGRLTFDWTPTSDQPPGGWIVKRYASSPARDTWHDRLHGHGPRCAAEREYDNLRALAALGIRVPAALAWSRRGRSSLVVMRRVEHEATLRQWLALPGQAERHARELLEIVTRLHAAGWYHRDLYLQHFLVTKEGLCLIDVGRARHERKPRQRWFEKDLAALLHSTPSSIPARARLAFLARYLAQRGLHPSGTAARSAVLRSWSARLELRRRRMAAHRPRHGEEPAGHHDQAPRPESSA